RVPGKTVTPLVDGPQRPLEPEPAQERHRPGERAPGAPREEPYRERDRGDDERALDPEVGAHVVAAERERETDRSERERARAAERALEQYRPRHGAAEAGMTP